MIYCLLADAVVLLHFAFLAFVVLGGLLVLRWRKAAWLHLPAVAWGAFVEMYLHYCPLTPLENWLREQAGHGSYGGGFIDHYIVPMIYPPGLTLRIQWLLGGLLLASYAIVYAIAWRRAKRHEGS